MPNLSGGTLCTPSISFIKVGDNVLIMSMNDLRQYRLRYDVSQYAIAKKMIGESGKPVSRQFVNQLELGTGGTWDASEDTKKAYLQALYEIVQERHDKKK